MIVQVAPDDPRLLLGAIAGHPLVATAIAGRAACPQPGMDWWVLPAADDRAAATLCRSGAAFYLTGDPACAAELTEFVGALGWERVVTDLPLALANPQPLIALDWQGSAPLLPELDEGDRLCYLTKQSARLSAVDFGRLQLQSGALSDDEEAERYTVSLSHAVRRGQAGAVALLRDGVPVAGAAVNHMAGNNAIVGAVAVLPQLRRQGLGTAAATAGVCLSFAMGRRPYLCCRDQLLPLYLEVGFDSIAPLTQYRTDPTPKGYLK